MSQNSVSLVSLREYRGRVPSISKTYLADPGHLV